MAKIGVGKANKRKQQPAFRLICSVCMAQFPFIVKAPSTALVETSFHTAESKMMKVVLLLVSVGFLPSISGAASHFPKVSTAQCSGHLQDLVVTSATCNYSENGCTEGSEVFVTGQGKRNDGRCTASKIDA